MADEVTTGAEAEAEGLSRAFLRALDEGRWMDAAALVDPHTREALHAWTVEHLHEVAEAPSFAGPSDTRFVLAPEMLQMVSGAAHLTSTEFLARFAEAVSRGALRQRCADRRCGDAHNTHVRRCGDQHFGSGDGAVPDGVVAWRSARSCDGRHPHDRPHPDERRVAGA